MDSTGKSYMKDKVLVDTNLWVYLYSDKPKGNIVKRLLDEHFANVTISIQILGELFNVLVKRGFKTKEEARDIISDLTMNFRVIEITKSSVFKAIEISVKYKYSYWDSLIIASALQNGCSSLYSEDMQDGQVIENKLKIINPFERVSKK